jgi:O-antigen/teichoic acid export membrane protein
MKFLNQYLNKKSEFAKNILLLMTGSVFSQAIPIAISPILTRLYTPEDFGVYAIFLSLITVIGGLSNARYESAIVIPLDDEEAWHVTVLSIFITLLVTFITLFSLIIFKTEIKNLMQIHDNGNFLYFVPISIFLTGVYQSLRMWFNREKKYKLISKNRVLQSASASFFSVVFGLFHLSGLITGQILGLFFSVFHFFREIQNKKLSFFSVSQKNLIQVAKRFQDFPKISLPAGLLNISSKEIPKLLVGSLLGTATLGFYSMAHRILVIPVSLIASSTQEAFLKYASDEYHKNGNIIKLYDNTIKKLFFISIGPFTVMYFISPDLFSFVFGENWRISGEFVRALIPFYFFYFIGAPMNVLFAIAEKQKLEFIWQFLFFVLSMSSLYLSSKFSKDPLFIIRSFSYSNAFVFFISILMTRKIAKGKL